jgi:hypothetical protein
MCYFNTIDILDLAGDIRRNHEILAKGKVLHSTVGFRTLRQLVLSHDIQAVTLDPF